MAKTPKKFRQARADAKKEAKKAFRGKRQGYKKDPTIKTSAEDRKALSEVSRESRSGYITDDRGNRVNVKPTETARERIARENAEAMRKFREQAEAEDGPKRPKKKAIVKKTAAAPAPAKKKAPVKKAAVKKAAAPAPSAEKKMTRAERSAANKAKWASMTPAERKNWSASKSAAAPSAPATKKTPVYSITDAKKGASDKSKPSKGVKKAKLSKSKALVPTAKGQPQTGKAVAVRPKGTVAVSGKGKEVAARTSKVTPVGMSGADKAKKFGKTRKFVKGTAATLALSALGAEAVSFAKGSSQKDYNEIVRLRNKLARAQGKKQEGNTFKEALGASGGSMLALATGGLVGKTRRERMDELNRMIAKQEQKNAAKQAKANSKLRYGAGGESLVPGTAAYKAGSKTKPTKAQVAASFAAKQTGGSKGGSAGAGVTGGGSTSKVIPGSTYTVKSGDTLSAIAKSAGVSLAEIRAANKKFKTNPKYKQGSMIWSGTKIRIPKK